jgi:hypothetical protein
MSTSEHSYGSISFTKSGYSQIMRHLREAFNSHQDNLYERTLALYTRLSKVSGKEKRALVTDNAFTYDSFSWSCAFTQDKYALLEDEAQAIKTELFRGTNGALCKPRKKAFAKLTNKRNDFSLAIAVGTINLYAKSNTLGWHVEENNRAVFGSEMSPMACILFSYLKRYTWKRGEGGIFFYQSEHTLMGARDGFDPTEERHRFGNKMNKYEKREHERTQRPARKR